MNHEVPFLSCLPGDIPGLLRDGSIIRHNGHRAVVLQVTEGFVLVAHHAGGADEEIEVEGGVVPWDLVALDLTDPTGSAHAARYAYHHPATQGFTGLMRDEHAAMESALHFDRMTPTPIDTLARLVLRLAGRNP